MHSIAICVFSVLYLVACANALVYTYSNQTAWNSLNGSSCDGMRQSPIDILTGQLSDGKDFGLTELVMTNWNARTTGSWSNNGHTVQYTPANAVATTETYLGVYNLAQLHFHWGPNNGVGSEHLVDGTPYSGELHFVHAKAETPDDPGNGFTVVGVLLEADPSMDIAGTVWDKFADIPPYDNYTELSDIVLQDMLPRNLSYYYYNGSLTTPLCSEVVQWVLLQYSLSVPQAFFDALRQTPKNANGTFLELNYREDQPLNGRQVYSFTALPSQTPPQTSPSPSPSSAATPTSTVALLLLALTALVLIQQR